MYWPIWAAVGLLATLFTFAWLLGHERIYFKAAISLGAWSIVAISAGDLYALDDSGTQVALEVPELQYFSAGLAVLSFFVLLLYRFDEYPPRREGQQTR